MVVDRENLYKLGILERNTSLKKADNHQIITDYSYKVSVVLSGMITSQTFSEFRIIASVSFMLDSSAILFILQCSIDDSLSINRALTMCLVSTLLIYTYLTFAIILCNISNHKLKGKKMLVFFLIFQYAHAHITWFIRSLIDSEVLHYNKHLDAYDSHRFWTML